jgi:hypothetical protein
VIVALEPWRRYREDQKKECGISGEKLDEPVFRKGENIDVRNRKKSNGKIKFQIHEIRWAGGKVHGFRDCNPRDGNRRSTASRIVGEREPRIPATYDSSFQVTLEGVEKKTDGQECDR